MVWLLDDLTRTKEAPVSADCATPALTFATAPLPLTAQPNGTPQRTTYPTPVISATRRKKARFRSVSMPQLTGTSW